MKQLSTHVFNDKYRQGSTYTNPHLMLSVASGEWNTFVTNFGQVSLLNALNQCITGIGGVTLQQAYNDSGGAASVNVNNGDVSWNSVGAFSFNIDLSGTTGVADGFQVTNGTDFLSLLRSAANQIAWTSEFETYDLNAAGAITVDSLATFSIDGVGASNISTTSGDLTVSTITTGTLRLASVGVWKATGTNFGFGTETFGTNAAGVIAVFSGTAPTTSVADQFQIWSADMGGTAGYACLNYRSEDGTVGCLGSRLGIGLANPSYKIHSYMASGDNFLCFENSSAQKWVIGVVDAATDYFAFGGIVGSTNGITVSQSSLVGIGTVDPRNFLEIRRDANLNANITIAHLLLSGNTDTNLRLYIGMDTTNNVGIINCQNYSHAYLSIGFYGLNYGFGTYTFGTSAVGVLGISSGTAPTTSPADMAQMWVADRGATAGKAGHHLRSEDGTSHVFSDKVGFGTVTPDGSAFVQMNSTAGGLLPPRMTTAQRVAIAAPADGLVVYDITLHAFCVFENATWMTLSAGVDTNIGKVAIFEDRRYPQANGGSATASKWHPRTLNFTRYNGMASRVSLQSFPIVAVDTVNHYFYVSGDQTAHLPTGRRFAVRGSTGNDLEGAAAVHDAYLCSAVSYDGGANQTRVTVAAIASNTADGSIYTGKIVFRPGTYLVEAQTTASASAAANFHGLLRLAVPTGFTYTSGYVNAEGATFTEVSPPDYAYDRKQLSLVLNEVLVISSVDTLYELQQYQDQTLADVGLGSRSNVGGAGFYEHYAPIKIKCLS